MQYVDYKCRCPQCAYSYTISTYKLPQGEWCPICGHWGAFSEFLQLKIPRLEATAHQDKQQGCQSSFSVVSIGQS